MAGQADIRKWFMKKPDHGKSKDEPKDDSTKSVPPSDGVGRVDTKPYKKESKFFAKDNGGGKGSVNPKPTVNKQKSKAGGKGGKRKSGEGLDDDDDFEVPERKVTPKKPRLVIPAPEECKEEGGTALRRKSSGQVVDTPPEKKRREAASKPEREMKTPARGKDGIQDKEKEAASLKPTPATRGEDSSDSSPERPSKAPASGGRVRGRGTAVGKGDDDKKPSPGTGRGRGAAIAKADNDKKPSGAGRGRGGWGGGGMPPWMQGGRGPPPHKGEKEIPQGADDALAGLTFVISGTLDSLEREEAETLIKSHGGRVTSSVSKKTSYLLSDEDVGGAKSKKAKELGVKVLTEDELLAMINASKPKPTQQLQTKSPAKPSPVKSPGESKRLGTEAAKDERSPKGSEGVTGTPARAVKQSIPPSRLGKAAPANESWTDKYKPKSTADIIGNPGIVKQLKDWLQRWEACFLHPAVVKNVKGKKKAAAGSSSSGEKKAVLLSGGPGIGKTTTATLVCKELGFDTLQVNASDSRGKADSKIGTGIGGRTSNTIKEMVNNEAISFGHQKSHFTKSVLIMDEVDGMSGGDRGGVADLIASIKMSRVPIICICNDKYSQKLKTLQNYCLPLVYRKPTKQQMGKRLQHVAKAEGIQVDDVTLEDIAERTNGDMRMALNQLQYMSLRTKTLKYADVHSRLLASGKDEDISPFTAADKLLGFDGGNLRMDVRVDLHMSDMDLVPLLVQENYVNFVPNASNRDQSGVTLMDLAARAALSIAEGDVINVQIRRRQQWQHSQAAAFMSSIIPAALMHGRRVEFSGGRNFNRFPGWLGKNSSFGKKKRLLEDVHVHMLCSRLCEPTREAIRLAYVPVLSLKLSHPLHHLPKEKAVEEVVQLMGEYSLTQDDYETILDVAKFKGGADLLQGVPAAVKTALTKRYKQGEHNRRVRSADLLPALTLPGQKKTTKKPARLKVTLKEEEVEGGLGEDGEEADIGEDGEDEDMLFMEKDI